MGEGAAKDEVVGSARPGLPVLLASALAVVLTGCVSLDDVFGYPPPQVIRPDYGVAPQDHVELVKRYYADIHLDPEATRYRTITAPVQYEVSKAAVDGEGDYSRYSPMYYGYAVCVTYNTKNRYGAYSGYRTDLLFIQHRNVVFRSDVLNCP